MSAFAFFETDNKAQTQKKVCSTHLQVMIISVSINNDDVFFQSGQLTI